MAMTNYDSARVALAICQRLFPAPDDQPAELFLPANVVETVCTAEHMLVALQCAGLDATLIDTLAPGVVMRDAIRNGWAALGCAGLRPAPIWQRWLVPYHYGGRTVEMLGEMAEAALFSPEPAYFQSVVIVVRGRQGHVPGQWPERN